MITTTIMGRLGADPETKTIGDTTVTECRVASTSRRGREDVTSWLRCSIWGARGEAFARFHRKGSRVHLSGEQHIREYETSDGQRGVSVELDVHGWAFADGKGEASEPAPSRSGGRGYGNRGANPADDVPF